MLFTTIIVIAVTCIVSFIGFNNIVFRDRYKFNIYAISDLKQVDRLLSSGFLHADLMHLLFNMFTFFFFSRVVIEYLGDVRFIIIYLLAILGGNLLTLWMYKRDLTYSALGASGGVSGIVFASIALFPQMKLMFFPIPIPLPAWIFGIAYLAYSTYGMKAALGNIGHSAHLGGAVVGFLAAIICAPWIMTVNAYYLGLISIPIVFLAYIAYKEK